MKLGELLSYLESIAPPVYQESYDNAGLIVGNRGMEITGVLLCLDSTEAVLDEAMQKGCNIVIAHHPIVFGGLKRFNGRSYVERVVMKAIKNDIAIYAAHTNLDNVFRNGVNGKIAERLGLINTQILSPKKGILKKLSTFVPKDEAEAIRNVLFDAGAGGIGNYTDCSFNMQGIGTYKGNEFSNPSVGKKGERQYASEEKIEVIFPAYKQNTVVSALIKAHSYEEVAHDIVSLDNHYQNIGSGMVGDLEKPMETSSFLKYLKDRMQTGCVRYTLPHTESISRVALCGGAGSFLLPNALRAKADIFITGDYKYHQFFDAEDKIIIADIGHYESEQFTIELFYELISQKFTNFVTYQTKVNTNPVNYL